MLLHLVIGIYDERGVQYPFWQLRIILSSLDDRDVSNALIVQSLSKSLERTVVNVDREDPTVRADRSCEATREKAVACSDVCDGHAGPDIHRGKDLVHLLPLFPTTFLVGPILSHQRRCRQQVRKACELTKTAPERM